MIFLAGYYVIGVGSMIILINSCSACKGRPDEISTRVPFKNVLKISEITPEIPLEKRGYFYGREKIPILTARDLINGY